MLETTAGSPVETEAESSLLSYVAELVDGKPHMLERNGKLEIIREQPLLEFLDDAVAGGANSAPGAGSSGSRMLISGDALEILEHIKHTVQGYGIGDDLASGVRAWAQACIDAGEVTEFEAMECAAAWCDRIRGLEVHEHSLNGACPVCGEQQVCEVDYSGGGKFIRSALTWNIHRAMCRVCGEKWTGQENMRILAVSLLQQS